MLTAVVTIIIFLVLISLHEFGHFIMAKLSGVSVLEFAVGMGPAIFKKQGVETLYSIRIFPIGGYCKLEGEDEKTDDPKAFCNQSVWKRILVVSAGAIFNLILGFILFVIITLIQPHNPGEPNLINVPVINSVVEHSYAEQSGLQPGDRIIEIDSHKVRIYEDVPLYTKNFKENAPFNVVVKRGKEKLSFDIIPTVREITYSYRENDVEITTVINGVSQTVVEQYREDAKEVVKSLIGTSETQKGFIIGFSPSTEEVGFSNLFSYSFHYTGYVVRMVYKSLWDMITGKIGFDQVSGPVGIVSAVNTAVNTGSYMLINILSLTALLSVNLGVFNLLPLPALDGGRLFFMLVELIRRKPVPADKEGLVHAIGLILLLAFSVFISFNDIMKLIK